MKNPDFDAALPNLARRRLFKHTGDLPTPTTAPAKTIHPGLREAFRFWLKLGFISFGGPAGQIAIMQSELVDKKRWISQSRFLHALNYCMLLPGPEAQQLAIYLGWLLHGTRGGIIAGGLFVLPSVFVLWTLSYLYAAFGHTLWVAAIFYGLKPVVMAIVAHAVIRIGRKALKNGLKWTVAAMAFLAIFFLRLPFPLIILAAGMLGLCGQRLWPAQFDARLNPSEASVPSDREESPRHARPSLNHTMATGAVWLLLWALPLLLAAAVLGTGSTVFREGIFFSKAAVVSFGGAYAALPYVAQQAVERYGWLRAPQMLDGLGLAETTPGPLIMVLQFVGFMGGWNQPGDLSPLLAATLGSLLTTWVTFVPCFLWVFLGAPHIERLRSHQALTAALSTITAAVVGVILNLAVWFALHVLQPAPCSFDWFALILGTIALIGLLRWKWDIIAVIVGGGIMGAAYRIVT